MNRDNVLPVLSRAFGPVLSRAFGLKFQGAIAQRDADWQVLLIIAEGFFHFWNSETCPCGARIESPSTHPHNIGCPVGKALALLEL